MAESEQDFESVITNAKGSGKSKIFTTRPYESMLELLAISLLQKYQNNPVLLSSVLIILPTKRSVRTLKELFVRHSQGQVLILPKIRTVNSPESWGGLEGLSIQSEVSPLERNMMLASLIMENSDKYKLGDFSFDMAFALATDLSGFIDDAITRNVGLEELKTLVPSDFALHWQKVLDFLMLITDIFPKSLQKAGKINPSARRTALINAKLQVWAKAPPSYPVIAAGIAGILPETAALLKGILKLPAGMVILRPFGKELPEDVWQKIDETNLYRQGKTLLEMLGLKREDIPYFASDNACKVPDFIKARARFTDMALYPSSMTHLWQSAEIPADALHNFYRIDAETPAQEAITACLIMRNTLQEAGKTAMLITADKSFAKRVSSELLRYGLDIEDSSGKPLNNTAVGVFLNLCAAAGQSGFAFADTLSLLKHPLAAAGKDLLRFKDSVRIWEKTIRSKHIPETSPLSESDYADFAELFTSNKTVPLRLVDKHLRFAEWLAGTDTEDGGLRLWQGDDGKMAAEVLAELAKYASVAGSINPAHYAALFNLILSGYTLRKNYKTHPRLDILGPLEARLQTADTVIIAGLNEGTYPALPAVNPWISNTMAKQLGLADADEQIGIEAADFASFCMAEKVYLLRSLKENGSPTVPSRWLFRMDALLQANNTATVNNESNESNNCNNIKTFSSSDFLKIGNMLDIPAYDEICADKPPAPCPAKSYRPLRLSVTEIEKLISDPYSIYAKHILKLYPLDAINKQAGAAEYGQALHAAFNTFINRHQTAIPDNAISELEVIADAEFKKNNISGAALAFWRPVFRRAAEWFLQNQKERVAGIKKIFTEEKRTIEIPLPVKGGGQDIFTLSGIFDRIDVLKDGSVSIIDYKTGSLPTIKQVKAGFYPQLPLESEMLRQGAFADIGIKKGTPVSALEYWKLSGKASGSFTTTVTKNPAETQETTNEVYNRIVNWLIEYNSDDKPYYVTPYSNFLPKYSDYKHLERIKEWSVQDDLDDDDGNGGGNGNGND